VRDTLTTYLHAKGRSSNALEQSFQRSDMQHMDTGSFQETDTSTFQNACSQQEPERVASSPVVVPAVPSKPAIRNVDLSQAQQKFRNTKREDAGHNSCSFCTVRRDDQTYPALQDQKGPSLILDVRGELDIVLGLEHCIQQSLYLSTTVDRYSAWPEQRWRLRTTMLQPVLTPSEESDVCSTKLRLTCGYVHRPALENGASGR